MIILNCLLLGLQVESLHSQAEIRRNTHRKEDLCLHPAWSNTNSLLKSSRDIGNGPIQFVSGTTDSVMIDKKITTAESGMDEGSSFRFLKCKKCKTYIGKQYKTTTQEFDHLRNYFSFDVNLITCYQIGSCDKESDIPQNDSILEVPTARSLQKSIHQLQALVIEMADKVVKIEERLENKTSNPKVSQASPRYMLSSPQKHLSRNGNPVTRRFPLESESVESESESESEGNAFVAENQYQASRRKGPQKRKR
ncbi:uncharacterized protein [Ptychodera flava]|uniref:uncharacterized protein isoform X1 n=1 Tax=Ptychodera flava TaxID=63121 RepID=UPI00396A29DB